MSEAKRGCGYRKIGGLYLVSSPGKMMVCDGLPMPLERCGCCGFVPQFSRNIQRLTVDYLRYVEYKLHDKEPGAIEDRHECKCPPQCPICYPENQAIPSYGLMFVGEQYTPRSFINEAKMMGVSKRIPEVPKWLILGETWVLLAHNKVEKDATLETLQENGLLEKEPEYHRAVFYAFKPERVEMPVWKGSLSDEDILLLEKHGITPVLLDPTPENKKLHKNAKTDTAMQLLNKWTREESAEKQ